VTTGRAGGLGLWTAQSRPWKRFPDRLPAVAPERLLSGAPTSIFFAAMRRFAQIGNSHGKLTPSSFYLTERLSDTNQMTTCNPVPYMPEHFCVSHGASSCCANLIGSRAWAGFNYSRSCQTSGVHRQSRWLT